MLRCDLQKLSEKVYRINFAFIPDCACIVEVWKRGDKEIRVVTTSPWSLRDEDDEREWRWCEYEKKHYIEKFLEWLGFEPLEED